MINYVSSLLSSKKSNVFDTTRLNFLPFRQKQSLRENERGGNWHLLTQRLVHKLFSSWHCSLLRTVLKAQTGRCLKRQAATLKDDVNLEEYTTSVLAYINKCMDDVTIRKTIKITPNQKPLLNAEVRSLLRAWDAAFRSGDSGTHAEAWQPAKRQQNRTML